MKGRTYRYFKGDAQFPFGYGLSYTTFSYDRPQLSSTEVASDGSATLSVKVSNTGNYDGEEVVQLYLQKPDDADGPLKALRGFERVFVPKGETVALRLALCAEVLEWWNPEIERMTPWAGDYRLWVGSTSRNDDLQPVDFKVVAD